MVLRTGTALWGGWVTGEALPSRGGLLRWQARRGETLGEVCLASASARLRDPTGERALRAAQLPEGSPLIAVEAGRVQGVVARLSSPLTPLDPALRIPHGQALQVLAWLGPAVAASGTALGGELDVQDLVLDEDGVVSLSPCGLARDDSLARLPTHRAPEWAAGSTSGAAALYGLGAWVYQAVTGAPHLSAANRGVLDAARQAPVPALQADPDLPPALAGALDALVSPDPARRLAVLAKLGAPEPVVLRLQGAQLQSAPPLPSASLPTARRAPGVQPGAQPSGSTRDLPLGEWVVLFDPTGATERGRRRLAALLDLESEHLQADHCLVVAAGRSRREAEAAAERLSQGTTALVVQPRPSGPAGAFALLGLAALFGASALLLPGLWAGVSLVASVGTLLGAKALQRRAAPVGTSRRVLAARWSALQAAVGVHPDHTAVGTALTRLQAARRALLLGDLNAVMRSDLLDAVEALDAEVRSLPEDADPEEVDGVLRALATLDAALAAAPRGRVDASGVHALESRVSAAVAALKDPSA